VDRVDLERIIRPFRMDVLDAQGRGRVTPRR
jgi:hypothetical protein